MKLSSVALGSFLVSAITAAPALHTVYVTAYTTVLVNREGETIRPTAQVTELPKPETTSSSEAPVPTTSSTEVEEPKPTSTKEPETTTSSTKEPEPTTSSTTSEKPEPTTSSSAPAPSSSSAASPTGSIQSGEGTYYDTGMGACGIVSHDSDYIIAVSHEMFDEHMIDGNPNHNPLCGKKIRAFYEGNSVEVAIVDRCTGCKYNDLDFSPAAFKQIADQGLGRIDITWEWI